MAYKNRGYLHEEHSVGWFFIKPFCSHSIAVVITWCSQTLRLESSGLAFLILFSFVLMNE